MRKKRFLTFLALLCLTVSGAWAQTYTVTFSGADSGSLNKAFNNVTMPYSFSAVNGLNLTPWNVIAGEGSSYTNVYVSSGGEGKVSVSYTWNNMTITISGAFEGTATIHCDGEGDEEGISRDVYVTCVETYKVSVKEGTEDADNWTITPPEAKTTGVAEGTEITATYSGTKLVKSVKAVKKPGPTDLSMVDCAGTARSDGQWTANCYMVHTAGDYYLPLVYGNAIKNGADNTAAYTGVSGSNTTATFPRHDGQAITAPWIKDNGITVASAELLWQDAQGLVTAVGIDGDYMTLTVGKNATEQEGNALVAAKDASGNIVWSWHIWVTKQTFATLAAVTVSGYNYQLTPVNLGWVGDATSTTGYHTYYQWGRKDAFIPSTGTDNANHTVYDINDATVTAFSHTDDNSMTIGGNIQHPTVHYRNKSTYGPCDTQYYNMWDAQQTSNTNAAAATVKTVYDPCPPGFCVPTSGLYNFIASQTRPEFNNGYTYSGVFFPASGYRNSSGGALGGVGKYGYYWSATPNDGTGGRNFYIHSSSWTLDYYDRTVGFPVRAVAE